MQFFDRRKARKSLHKSIRNALHVLAMREDLFSPEEHAQFNDALTRARAAHKDGTADEMRAAEAMLEENVLAVSPNVSFPEMRNIFEMWVTALAVAMAFRAYFYQPFRIPTNSMYPTLYGITSIDENNWSKQNGVTPGNASNPHYDERWLAKFPAWLRIDGNKHWSDETALTKIPKWLLTASWYKKVVAREGGEFRVWPQGPKPGYGMFQASGGQQYHVPTDAVYRMRQAGLLQPTHPDSYTTSLRYGQTIWEGRVTLGDFVFVNRWKWNFRRPQRGEVMVFSTEEIKALPPRQHYIKRMCGIPGDTLEIRRPDLLLDGAPIIKGMIGRIAGGEKVGDWTTRPFAGYLYADLENRLERKSPSQMLRPGDAVKLDSASYYALGDNSGESSDSRFWGTVPEKNLLGPGAVVYWPFVNPRWGRIP